MPTAYKILSNILLQSLAPYVEEITGDHQCGFRHKISASDHRFSIRQILEKKWEYNKAVHQLLMYFKRAYDSGRREVLCIIIIIIIIIIFGILMKQIRLIKMCLNETCSRGRVGKHLSDMFPIKNDFIQGDALSRLFFSVAVEYADRRVQVNQDGLKLNGAHQHLVYADDEYNGRKSTYCEEKHKLVASKETGLEVNADKTKYMAMS